MPMATAAMAAGVALTLVPHPAVLVPALVLVTGAFFAAHSVASAWSGTAAPHGRAQSTSLYNLAYYAGSSLFGWLGGVFHESHGWPGTVLMVLALFHAVAALVHHYLWHDAVLRRMLPRGS